MGGALEGQSQHTANRQNYPESLTVALFHMSTKDFKMLFSSPHILVFALALFFRVYAITQHIMCDAQRTASLLVFTQRIQGLIGFRKQL